MGVIIQSDSEFESFFKEFFPAVYAFVRKYTGDDELAADLAQEAFVKVYERRAEIGSVESGRAYLYTVARHLYWSHCKRKQVEEKYVSTLDEDDGDDYDFLKEVTWQETLRILHTAIDQLPAQTREIILLNLEGKNNAEVAELLNMSVNTVKYLKKGAYVILRELLSKEYLLLLIILLEK